MKNLLREAVERKKQFLINKLISQGAYKKDGRHLFELTLSELQKECKSFRKQI